MRRPIPWIAGSFYLISALTVLTLLLVAPNTVSVVVLPLVVLGSLLTIAVIGALQLRQDRSLSQEHFITLMLLTFR